MLQSQAKYIKLMSLRDKSNWIWVSWRFTQSCHCIMNKVVWKYYSGKRCFTNSEVWMPHTITTVIGLNWSHKAVPDIIFIFNVYMIFFKTETSCQFQRILINKICLSHSFFKSWYRIRHLLKIHFQKAG